VVVVLESLDERLSCHSLRERTLLVLFDHGLRELLEVFELSELTNGMEQFPQVLLNVKVSRPVDPNGEPAVRTAVCEAESALGKRGRVVLRASGTEPVIRIMVEGEDRYQVNTLATQLADCVRTAFSREA